MVQSPHNSVQKSELYAIMMVLMDFTTSLNKVTDSSMQRELFYTLKWLIFINDESELTSLFILLQEIIRTRNHPFYITHIWSHTGLPGPLAQSNDEIDQLLIGNMLEATVSLKVSHKYQRIKKWFTYHLATSEINCITVSHLDVQSRRDSIQKSLQAKEYWTYWYQYIL